MVAEADVSVNHPIGLGKVGLRRWMHSVLRMEKMFSAMALSWRISFSLHRWRNAIKMRLERIITIATIEYESLDKS